MGGIIDKLEGERVGKENGKEGKEGLLARKDEDKRSHHRGEGLMDECRRGEEGGKEEVGKGGID